MGQRTQSLPALRQDVDDMLCRLIDGTVSYDEAAFWAAEHLNQGMPKGREWHGDPRLWEALALFLDLGPHLVPVQAPPGHLEKLLQRFREPAKPRP